MDDALTLPVAEVFGPVWQGEGPAAGQRCAFVRLGLCNLHCAWCDTPYTWDRRRFDVGAECPPMTVGTILERLDRIGAELVVLSGGEPLLHANRPAFQALIGQQRGRLHVETNGTLIPPAAVAREVDLFVVSPKVAQDDDPITRRLLPNVLTWFADHTRCEFKFVAREPNDVEAIDRLVREVRLPRSMVWVMPEGTDAEGLLATARWIAEDVQAAGFNLTLRQHILLYGNQRGT